MCELNKYGLTPFSSQAPSPGLYIVQIDDIDPKNPTMWETYFKLFEIDKNGKMYSPQYDDISKCFITQHEQEADLKGGTAVAWKPAKVKLIKPITQ